MIAIENSPILEVRNLKKSYGELSVLRDISFSANSGSVISFIGSSGSGKSTLLRCCNLLEIPQGGEIIFKGEAVSWTSEAETRQLSDKKQIIKFRTNLSMVFQSFNLWSHLSILDNIVEAPVTVLGKDRQTMRDVALTLLDKVGIADKAENWPSQLSGGQQQRAAIARALAMEPDALLFDEPTSALDPELEQEVVKVIKDLASEGRTMLLVTHDMQLARELSDRVFFLHQGIVEEEGRPDSLFENPKSNRLKQFLSAAAS